MKVRDSGMPEQTYWESLFDVEGMLDEMGVGPQTGDVAELGVRALLEKDLCALGTHHVRHPSPDQ